LHAARAVQTVIYESQCTGFTPGGGSLCLWTSSDFNFDK
jgi:hypothetical protein